MTRLKFLHVIFRLVALCVGKINIELAQKKPIPYINKHKNNTIEDLDFKFKETIKNFRIIIGVC